MKYSKNTKLNNLLTSIESDLLYLGIEEITHYTNTFKFEPDFNIAQYGNLVVYYDDLYKLYRECGYKSTDKMSTDKLWNTYKRQVGYVARQLVK